MNVSHVLVVASLLILCGPARAHPEPDIPVRSHFQKDGNCTITLEFDPRCFSKTPITEPYLLKKDLASYTPEKKQELLTKASDAVNRWIEFKFEPIGLTKTEFKFDFGGLDEAPLTKDEDPVKIIATWKTHAPAESTGWRIAATKATPFAIIFRNYIEGVEQPKFNVLFPGETSFLLKLTNVK